MTPYASPSSDHRHCQLCRLPAKGHPQCSACHVLVGPGHRDAYVDADGRCHGCARARERARAIQQPVVTETKPPVAITAGEVQTALARARQ